MIIKGTSRSGPAGLAKHLGNAEKNERVQVLESRGTVAQDLRGALLEMDSYAIGTRCEKPLYHAAISPEPPHRLTPEQRAEAINALEEKLGLTGHARIVVLHEKDGREHLHVVWSRIDLDRMKSVSDSHNYRKHEECARDLERRFGHDRVQGAHHEREGIERPDRTPSRSELRQEERTGITGKQVKAEVTEAFRSSDTAEAFKVALEDRGYILAQGDRRDFVVIDREGGVHSLARRIEGIKAAELREFMRPIDREALPTVDQAKEAVAARLAQKDERDPDDERRKAEARADDRIEAAYAKGDDYVHQASAAQKDFERRQRGLDEENDFRPERPGERTKDEEDELRRRDQEKTAQNQAEVNAQSESKPTAQDHGNLEITDRMARLLGGAEERERERDQNLAERHREAPGGGRSRSRFE